jgi:HEAT repeat protein
MAAAERDQDWVVRRNAVRYLSHIGDPQSVPLLLRILRNDTEDVVVRGSAAWGLGGIAEFDDDAMIETLHGVIREEAQKIRKTVVSDGATRALEQLGVTNSGMNWTVRL